MLWCPGWPSLGLTITSVSDNIVFFPLLLGVEEPFIVQDKYIIMLWVCAVFLFFYWLNLPGELYNFVFVFYYVLLFLIVSTFMLCNRQYFDLNIVYVWVEKVRYKYTVYTLKHFWMGDFRVYAPECKMILSNSNACFKAF